MIKLEHVGIAIDDAESALAIIKNILGEAPYKSETVPTERVRTHFIRSGGAKLELLEPLNSESPVARFIRKRGQGLHHLAFEVDDIHTTRDRLLEAGFSIIGDAPRPGADGKNVFFVHPRDTGGVLFEFCRQDRSVFENSSAEIRQNGPPLHRAGRRGNPPLLVVDSGVVDIELLVRRLEQSAYVLVVRHEAVLEGTEILDPLGIERVHVAATPRILKDVNLPPTRRLSSIVFVDAEVDAFSSDGDILIAADAPHAAAAARLWSRVPDADLVVGDDELIALAVEKHIQRIDAA